MTLVWTKLGNKLLATAKGTSSQAILVSPFITRNAFNKLLENIPHGVEIRCFTRWRVEELAAGISDIEIWNTVRNRKNCKLFLINNLHSKYYRFDSNVFVGSANLTFPGLSWARFSNVETLTIDEKVTDNHLQYETFLHNNAMVATEEIYARMVINVKSYILDSADYLSFTDEYLPEFIAENVSDVSINAIWMPVTRSPDALYLAYKALKENLSKEVYEGCLIDLAHFEAPLYLDKNKFKNMIGSRLETEPIVLAINQFLSQPRRFGEMVEFIKNYVSEDAPSQWQLMMRWLLYFLPTRYSAKVANHSEIFSLNMENY
jgi:hypothetical protein